MLKLFKRGAEKPLIVSNIAGLTTNGTDYFAQDLILLNEPLKGSLYCAEQILIEVDANLVGNATGKVCIINGTVTGNIIATEQLLIRETAKIYGNISAPEMDIEPGAIVNGKVQVATDIYAIVELAEKLKSNIPSEEVPQNLRIVPGSLAVTGRSDDQLKSVVQKSITAKPSAPKPIQQEPIVATPVKKQIAVAASSGLSQHEEIVVVKKRAVAAASAAKPATPAPEQPIVPAKQPTSPDTKAVTKPKPATDENQGGKWW